MSESPDVRTGEFPDLGISGFHEFWSLFLYSPPEINADSAEGKALLSRGIWGPSGPGVSFPARGPRRWLGRATAAIVLTPMPDTFLSVPQPPTRSSAQSLSPLHTRGH